MRIWKQTLDLVDCQRIMFPQGSKFLTAQMQGNLLSLWFECNEKNPLKEIVIAIYGTGNPIPDNPGKYIATFQTGGGALVFHVYDLYGEI